MATGKPGDEVLEPVPASAAASEVGDDAQSEGVAADAGEMLTEQIGGSTDVAGANGADHFNVMALPAHRAATGGTWRCCGQGGEVGDGEPEVRIGCDRATERLYGGGGVRGPLCLAIKGGGHDVGGDHSTVVLDRRATRGRLAAAGVGRFGVAMHAYEDGRTT
jgi:hypothetical protein